MANKLKNMHLTSVDLVRAGANQEADICIYKSADHAEAPEKPTEQAKGIIERFIGWLTENPPEAQEEPQTEPELKKEDPQEETAEDNSKTFREIAGERTANETLDLYLDAIEDSIESIQLDDELDETRKNEVMLESLQEFITAMKELIPELCQSKPEEECHEEVEKSEEEPDTIQYGGIDTIEEA